MLASSCESFIQEATDVEDSSMKNNCLLRRVCNPRGLGELAAPQVLPGHPPPFQHGAVRWLKTGKVMLMLMGVLAASVCLSPSLHAGIITFTAGDETAVHNGTVYLPITVSSFSDVIGAGFSLSWDSGVLQYVGTGNYNSTLVAAGLNGSCFNLDLNSGNLGFSWTDTLAPGQTLGNGITIFTVQFTAIGTSGTSSPVNFVDIPTPRDVLFSDSSEITPSTAPGGVTVVPEPVNWALGFFSCIFIGGATVRWISNRRMALQPAQTWRQ